MQTTDEEAAIAAISTLSSPSEEQSTAATRIAEILSNHEEPHLDILELFGLYSTLYFRSLLVPRVEVSWSQRLTSSAGMCELVKDSAGKYTRIRLKLSEPLLKFRPREDTVNTLLHEAIHAYFFITVGWAHSRGDDGTGHGVGFLLLADAISNHGQYKITVYHTFHEEVDSYRTHVWQCNGPCRTSPPLFGLVKRSMNRPPGKSDIWWEQHARDCGGTYTKIKEPELTKAQLEKMTPKQRAGRQKNKIDTWITAAANSQAKLEPNQTPSNSFTRPDSSAIQGLSKRKLSMEETPELADSKRPCLACPICGTAVTELTVNEHLDTVHI